eukprot:scaffold12255_cov18-Tisochrysis_lutea.AAC.2
MHQHIHTHLGHLSKVHVAHNLEGACRQQASRQAPPHVGIPIAAVATTKARAPVAAAILIAAVRTTTPDDCTASALYSTS